MRGASMTYVSCLVIFFRPFPFILPSAPFTFTGVMRFPYRPLKYTVPISFPSILLLCSGFCYEDHRGSKRRDRQLRTACRGKETRRLGVLDFLLRRRRPRRRRRQSTLLLLHSSAEETPSALDFARRYSRFARNCVARGPRRQRDSVSGIVSARLFLFFVGTPLHNYYFFLHTSFIHYWQDGFYSL